MYLTKRSALKQEYIIIGATIFISLVLVTGFYIMFMSAARELISVNSKLRKGQMIVPDVSGYRKQYATLEADIGSISREIAKNKERLFWKKDIALFIEQLSRVAEQIAVDFISIRPASNPEPVTADDKQKTVLMYRRPVTITMKSGYRELMDFLARVEDSERFFRVDELTIEPDRKDILKRNVTMVLSIFSAD